MTAKINEKAVVEHQTLDAERALYGSDGLCVRACTFDGPADGESALKECQNIEVERSLFRLRYPFWHDRVLRISDCELSESCRAALWYSEDVDISRTKLHGIKALRECRSVTVRDSDVISAEFGWSVRGLEMTDTTVRGEYFMLRSEGLHFRNVTLDGKYSFQYVKNATFEDCEFVTKDAFWHAEHVTLRNCTVKGEYLAWYAKDITFERCTVIGTQPFCYCQGLRLIDCAMIDADLAFERSEVEATLTTPVISIKNPRSGSITLPSLGECIMDDPAAKGTVILKK